MIICLNIWKSVAQCIHSCTYHICARPISKMIFLIALIQCSAGAKDNSHSIYNILWQDCKKQFWLWNNMNQHYNNLNIRIVFIGSLPISKYTIAVLYSSLDLIYSKSIFSILFAAIRILRAFTLAQNLKLWDHGLNLWHFCNSFVFLPYLTASLIHFQFSHTLLTFCLSLT